MIKVLEKNIADKIAAGEVIERPVSIIKELVENSIDAGADSIVVEIKNGGKTYIRVTDNGCGIAREEVETAFLRHATSKISTVGDLDAIETLGFRGEALASIAAVTHTEFITKTKNAKMGVKLLIHGSEVIANSGTGCPDGTTIIVTDLFYNTPARRKFLKSDGAESGQIIDFMSQIALAYPAVKFRFINNSNIVFSTTGKGDVLAAILAVYKISEFRDLVPVSYEKDGNQVSGYISRPSLSRTNRKNQIFFVNGRVVSSKVIEKGVAAGYRERLFDGRYPVAFLFLKTDPASLDVNIHPNKKEVRFDREEDITGLVAEGIIQALGTKSAVTEVKNIFKAAPAKTEPRPVETQVSIAKPKAEEVPAHKTEPKLKLELELESQSETKRKISSEAEVDIKQILSTRRESLRVAEEQVPYETPPAASEPMVEIPKEVSETPQKPTISIALPAMEPFDFQSLTLTGAIFGTYITAVEGNYFYLIDQHAAHERVFYEKLVGEYLEGEKLRQPILTPILLEVPLAVKEYEYDWLDCLSDMGFTIEEFGQNSYVIKEIPTFMTISEAEDFAKEFIDSVSDGTKMLNTVVINKLITKSCKAAVKANDKLSMEEMKALITQLSACKNPFSCPHGRPTFIRLSKYEVEKMFKRV